MVSASQERIYNTDDVYYFDVIPPDVTSIKILEGNSGIFFGRGEHLEWLRGTVMFKFRNVTGPVETLTDGNKTEKITYLRK